MYKLCFFVPEAQVEKVKMAIFEAGAGKIGNYDCCSWQTLGVGQFRPLAGSNPALGHHGQVEIVNEFKVECVCEVDKITAVVAALKGAHPYEEPAYEVYLLESL
ncbi:MAG: NGG1p interacting factor NIF3 [Hahellaceae bacterium]|nr:NGG1p interacting factor NIF3 [Hahellaceae bacterium]MCP5212833.1 NGG1p interacting factor NIF3 [Hahellaceae bacterium]